MRRRLHDVARLSSTPVVWIAAVAAELRSLERLASQLNSSNPLLPGLSQQIHDQSDALVCRAKKNNTTQLVILCVCCISGLCGPVTETSTKHQLRAWFEKALEQTQNRSCILLWRLYMYTEASAKLRQKTSLCDICDDNEQERCFVLGRTQGPTPRFASTPPPPFSTVGANLCVVFHRPLMQSNISSTMPINVAPNRVVRSWFCQKRIRHVQSPTRSICQISSSTVTRLPRRTFSTELFNSALEPR